MNDDADIAEAHAATLRRLRERSAELTERAYFRASAALGADDGEGAACWMEMFERLARGLRLSIALEARAARERRRGLDAAAASAGSQRARPAADPAERDPVERDRERDDDGLPSDANLDEQIAYISGIVEDAPAEFEPRIRLIAPRRAPTWADVPQSLLPAPGLRRPAAPPQDSG